MDFFAFARQNARSEFKGATTMIQWIIEARTPEGALDLKGRQPEDVFGMAAIHGLSDDAIAKTVWRYVPDAVLTGDSIPLWPSKIDERFIARRKTW